MVTAQLGPARLAGHRVAGRRVAVARAQPDLVAAHFREFRRPRAQQRLLERCALVA